MEVTKEHIRHILLFFFRKSENASETARQIKEVYGEDIISVSQVCRWFQKFRSGNFNLLDEPRSGRPIEFDEDSLKSLVESNPTLTVEELAKELNAAPSTVQRHLHILGKVSKLGKWVPHELSEANRLRRVSDCYTLLTRLRHEPFLERIVTGDEKWVLYHNVKRKRSWVDPNQPSTSQAKPGLHPLKILLSVWWDMKGIIHFELLGPNETINADVYCQQLERLQEKLREKRPGLVNRRGVLFHQDNARPHTARQTLDKILELGWEMMIHPPYSPDIAPSDYHLFRSLQAYLAGKKMDSVEDVRTTLQDFFSSKPQDFYKDGIQKLVNRWRTIVENDGNYIDD